ncbi:MAG: hypothetical protein QNJ54_03265 [Prochloraceae cyanobacterium]|nr:hypothetical protein [Prochloraceae cyanobacterium]
MTEYRSTPNHFRRIFKLLAFACVGLFLFLWGGQIHQLDSYELFETQKATAQILRPQQVADRLYQRLSFIPQENQYISTETGEVEQNNTLVNRLIRYHFYVKSRSVNSRFDWKLTIADYLGYNEELQESRYPGHSRLKENPIESDREAIESLTRRQRNELVNTLFAIYNPEGAKLLEQQPVTRETTSESQEDSNSQPRLRSPKPGDAELLAP